MKIICEQCKKKNKGRYSTFSFNDKLVTLCDDCRWGTTNTTSASDKDKKMFEHISTPWWIHAGVKPNAKQQAQLDMLKRTGKTWGDLRKERYAQMPQNPAANGSQAFQEHYNKYGTKNAPEVNYRKSSKAS